MALVYDFSIEQGETLDNTNIAPLTLKLQDNSNFDLTGWAATAHIKKSYRDAVATATFATSVDIPTATIQLSMDAVDSEAIPAGVYVYDVEIAKAGVIRKVVKGKITVNPEVTK